MKKQFAMFAILILITNMIFHLGRGNAQKIKGNFKPNKQEIQIAVKNHNQQALKSKRNKRSGVLTGVKQKHKKRTKNHVITGKKSRSSSHAKKSRRKKSNSLQANGQNGPNTNRQIH